MRRLLLNKLSFLFILIPSLLWVSDLSAKESYKKNLIIGVIGPMTGEGAEYGKPMLEGIQLAAKEFNKAGGINGEKIKLLARDNGAEQGATTRILNEFLAEKVTAIIASPGGWSTFGPVATANRSWTILMSVGSQRHIGKSGNFIFRNSLPDEIATEQSIKYCSEKLGYKRYAIVTSMVDDEASLSAAGFYRRALQKYGGKVVAEAFTGFDMGLKESVAALKQDAKGPIDAVIFAGKAKAGAEILKELRRNGIKAPLIGGEGLKNRKFLKLAGKATVGTILYTSFTSLSKDQTTRRFVKSFRKETAHYPSPLSALGYDSFMLIAEAIKKSGTTEPKQVANDLWDTKDYQGVSGPISMDDSGETIKSAYLLKVVQGKKRPFFTLVK
ncbi:MAG: ABC transporter substrate-binding protein [Proteobacteria bacterium]|nr:ABC transporter substrate-binding protein [Pseudomonadota bacterium]